jgi:hypothetical protein
VPDLLTEASGSSRPPDQPAAGLGNCVPFLESGHARWEVRRAELRALLALRGRGGRIISPGDFHLMKVVDSGLGKVGSKQTAAAGGLERFGKLSSFVDLYVSV